MDAVMAGAGDESADGEISGAADCGKDVRELKTPLAISTSDINEGITVYYTSGSLAQPLRRRAPIRRCLCRFNTTGGHWWMDF